MQFAYVRINLYIRLLLIIVPLLHFLPLNQRLNLPLLLPPLPIRTLSFLLGISGGLEVLLLVAVFDEFPGIECPLAGEGGPAIVLLEPVDIVFLH